MTLKCPKDKLNQLWTAVLRYLITSESLSQILSLHRAYVITVSGQ